MGNMAQTRMVIFFLISNIFYIGSPLIEFRALRAQGLKGTPAVFVSWPPVSFLLSQSEAVYQHQLSEKVIGKKWVWLSRAPCSTSLHGTVQETRAGT